MTNRDRLVRERLQARLDRAARTAGLSRREPAGPAPLSPMQESIWMMQRMEPESTVYHRPVALRLSGTLDEDALRRALGDLVERHESLRSVYPWDGHPCQTVQPAAPVPLTTIDLRGAADAPAEARRRAAELAREPIDLEHGPTVQAQLFRTGEGDHLLALHLHHLSFDGWSEGTLCSDLATAYAARRRGDAPPFEPLPVQMADIAAWHQERRANGAHADHLAYWRRQLADLPTTLDLPTDRPRAGASAESATHAFHLSADLTGRLRALARREGATLYMVLLAGLQALLARYSRQGDFAIGSPVAGRTRAEMEGVVGCLINVLVLRARVDPDAPFLALLGRVRQTVLEALDHQEAPLADVVAEAFPGRRGFAPVYPVLFQLRNLPPVEADVTCGLQPVRMAASEIATELSLDVVACDDGTLSCHLTYRTDLFAAATAERMARHLSVLLDAVATDSDQAVGRLPMLTPHERDGLLGGHQAPSLPPLDVGGIQVLVEQQAARQPDAPALVFGDDVLTFGELNAQANRLAWRLQALGVGPDVPVALAMGRSAELNTAILAVLKAGGAYVPLDPEYPVARTQTILDNVRAPLLLCLGPCPWPGLTRAGLQVLDLDALDLSDESDADPPTEGLPPDRAAYVLYTSGSTGEPKGAAITQANLLAAAPSWESAYRLGSWNRFVQTARPTFDVHTEAWIRSIGYGASLVDCPPEVLLDPPRFVRFIRDHQIDVLCGVPAVYRLLTAHLERTGQRLDSVRFVILGADVWHPDDHERLQAVLPHATVLNTYGITEVTVSNAYFEGDAPRLPSGSVPIGRPYSNSRLYVLDPYGEPVPVGVPGELFVGGPVVGAGYVGRPDLTAERFVRDPFSDEPGARMYRTGDLVRWLPTGDLDFLGRTDFQVKVRGLRIELGEVEAVLAGHPGVAEAVATVRRGGADDDALVAYVVAAPGATLDADAVRGRARALLPAYMVPTALAVLDRLPLSANGKVDRRALPPIEPPSAAPGAAAPPQTPEEAAIAGIWAEVLGLQAVGRSDDFFDLGGHSLRAIQVLTRVGQRWGVTLSFRDLVDAPTLGAFAARVHEQTAALGTLLDDLGALSDGDLSNLLGSL